MYVTFSQKNLDDGYALITIEPEDNEHFIGGEGIVISRVIATGEEYLGADKGVWTGKKEILKVAGKLENGRLLFKLEPYYVNNINKGGYSVYLFDKDGNETDYSGDVFINGVRKSQILSEGFGLSEETGAGPRDEAREAFENVSRLVSDSTAKINEINLQINKTNNALLTLSDVFSSGNGVTIEHDYTALAEALAPLKKKKEELDKLSAGVRQGINNSKIASDSEIFPKAKAMVEEYEAKVQNLEALFSDVLKRAENMKPRFDAYQKRKADEAQKIQERQELEKRELERKEHERKELEKEEADTEKSMTDTASVSDPDEMNSSEERASSLSDGDKVDFFSGSQAGAATERDREHAKSPVLFIILGVILLTGIAGATWYFLNQSSADVISEQTKTPSVNDDATNAAEEAARGGAERKAAEEAERAEAERKAAEEAERAEAERKAAEEAERAEAERKAAEEAQKAEAERKAAEEAATAEAARKEAKGNVKSRVAEFLKSETKDSESAMELAEDLDPQTAHDQDLIFKLYYFAAMRDNEKGSLRYAECLDPSKPAWGSIEKDPVEAWEYYGKSSDGISMRQNMKDWVEREANNGNSQAKKWLKKLK